jgi:hypothetical protein
VLKVEYFRNIVKVVCKTFFMISVFLIRRSSKKQGNKTLECIIFSKDRAMQLHALLSSYFDKVVSPVQVHVLYHTSNSNHQKSYEDLIFIYRDLNVSFIRQLNNLSFRRDFLKLLSSLLSGKVMFLVDDVVFVNEIDLHDIAGYDLINYVPSLRMGCNIDFDVDSTPGWSPRIIGNNKIEWFWNQGSYAWGYPLSLDGHIFLRKEILHLSKWISFNGPNSLETNLQLFKYLYSNHQGLAERMSVIVNSPCNKVQMENENLCGDIHQDFLLEQWHKGYQIDYKKLSGLHHSCTHKDISLAMITRELGHQH